MSSEVAQPPGVTPDRGTGRGRARSPTPSTPRSHRSRGSGGTPGRQGPPSTRPKKKGAGPRQQDEDGSAGMRHPPRHEQPGGGSRQVVNRERGRCVVVADVVEGHDNHDEAAQNVDRHEPRARVVHKSLRLGRVRRCQAPRFCCKVRRSAGTARSRTAPTGGDR